MNWNDQLTSYNGAGITCDGMGNPTSYGTWSYSWEHGRQLKQMMSSATTACFVYNKDGIRVQKAVNSIATYIYMLVPLKLSGRGREKRRTAS